MLKKKKKILYLMQIYLIYMYHNLYIFVLNINNLFHLFKNKI
jgi:hypothetical protein